MIERILDWIDTLPDINIIGAMALIFVVLTYLSHRLNSR